MTATLFAPSTGARAHLGAGAPVVGRLDDCRLVFADTDDLTADPGTHGFTGLVEPMGPPSCRGEPEEVLRRTWEGLLPVAEGWYPFAAVAGRQFRAITVWTRMMCRARR